MNNQRDDRPVLVSEPGNRPENMESDSYVKPRLFRVGAVKAVTRGSSSSGTSDANSQYYW